MLAAIALSAVTAINVSISSINSESATYSLTQTYSVTRSGDRFLRDGVPVSTPAVARLVAAATAEVPHFATDPTMEGALAIAREQSLSSCVGAITQVPMALHAYREAFDSRPLLAHYVESLPATMATGVETHTIAVDILGEGGPLARLISVRRTPGGWTAPTFIPFGREQAGKTDLTYSLELPDAIAALAPPTLGSASALDRRWLIGRWAQFVCTDKSIGLSDLVIDGFLPSAKRVATRRGLRLEGSLDPGLVGFVGTIEPLHGSEFSANVVADGNDSAVARAVSASADQLVRLLSTAWLSDAYRRRYVSGASIETFVGMTDLNAYDVDRLRAAGKNAAADRLARDLAGSRTVYMRSPGEGTIWYLLPNGDMLLVDYLGARTPLPFQPTEAAEMTRRGVLEQNREATIIGLIVHPDGSYIAE